MRSSKRVGVVLFLVLAVAAAAAVLLPGSDSNTVAANQTVANPGVNAMKVYLDPETGEVTSTPPADAVIDLDPDMANTLRHDDEGLQVVRHPNGTLSLDTQGRYGDVMMVRIGENGRQMVCVDNADAAKKTLTDTTTPTGPEVK